MRIHMCLVPDNVMQCQHGLSIVVSVSQMDFKWERFVVSIYLMLQIIRRAVFMRQFFVFRVIAAFEQRQALQAEISRLI